jgi:hypothetical protein
MSSYINVIGFTGKAGSGKSTLSRHILDVHGGTLVKFADPMKSMLRTFGLTDYEIEGDGKGKPCELLGGQTPRYAMQTLGTEWGRVTISDNIWVDAWSRKASEIISLGSRIICDDVRFPNEVAAIQKLGGIVIRVCNPSILSEDGHISENKDLRHDHVILNNGTITELYEKLDNYLRNRL